MARRAPADTAGSGGEAGRAAQQGSGDAAAQRAGGKPGAVEDYLTQVRAYLEEHKRYPRRARLRRQEGVVHLRFVLDRSGRVLSHEVVEGSGHGLLDQEARDMLQRAQPLPPIPDQLGRERIELVLPIAFAVR